jgi:hypothetical protein
VGLREPVRMRTKMTKKSHPKEEEPRKETTMATTTTY